MGIAIDAIRAAAHPHHFMGVTKQGLSAIIATRVYYYSLLSLLFSSFFLHSLSLFFNSFFLSLLIFSLMILSSLLLLIIIKKGNQHTHVVLRGSNTGPNYEEKFVKEAVDALVKSNVNPALMVDCSHGNSSKVAKNQLLVAKDIVYSLSLFFLFFFFPSLVFSLFFVSFISFQYFLSLFPSVFPSLSYLFPFFCLDIILTEV